MTIRVNRTSKDEEIASLNARILALESRITEFDAMHNETIKARDAARVEAANLSSLVKRMSYFVEYADHNVDCHYYDIVDPPGNPCDCGLDGFKAEVVAVVHGMDNAARKESV